MRSPRKPEWITFDCYGTLIDTETGYVQAWKELLADKGLSQEAEVADLMRLAGKGYWRLIEGPYIKFREVLRHSSEDALRQCGLPVEEGDGQHIADAYGTFPPFPDVNPILTILRKEFKLAIISNVDNDIVAKSIASMGVEFDGIYTAEKCRAYKPSPIPFEYALNQMQVAPERVLHVAFGYEFDHGRATEMGFMTVWLNRQGGRLPEGFTVDIEMPDLIGLPAYVGLE
jgi:2-haloacid dehalogenase